MWQLASVEVVAPDSSDGQEPVVPELTEEPIQDQPDTTDAIATPTHEPVGEVIVDPTIDDAAIYNDLVVSDGGAITSDATDSPIVIKPDTGGNPIDGIDIAIQIEGPAVILGH
jgi:hypothetical protein